MLTRSVTCIDVSKVPLGMLMVVRTVQGPTANVVDVSAAELNVPLDETITGIVNWPIPDTTSLVLARPVIATTSLKWSSHDCGVVADRTSEALPKVSAANVRTKKAIGTEPNRSLTMSSSNYRVNARCCPAIVFDYRTLRRTPTVVRYSASAPPRSSRLG